MCLKIAGEKLHKQSKEKKTSNWGIKLYSQTSTKNYHGLDMPLHSGHIILMSSQPVFALSP
jgi:hypothetical protein